MCVPWSSASGMEDMRPPSWRQYGAAKILLAVDDTVLAEYTTDAYANVAGRSASLPRQAPALP